MHASMRHRIDQLLAKIKPYQDTRKSLIKREEETLLRRVEVDVVELLQHNGFYIIEHQLGDWVIAKRGLDSLRIWFPKQKDNFLGIYSINLVYNDVASKISVLVKHKYADIEYNYLSLNYTEKLQREIDELQQQLDDLKQLSNDDIGHSYLMCRHDVGIDNNDELKSSADCLRDLLNKNEDDE